MPPRTLASLAHALDTAPDLDAALVTTEKDFVRLAPVMREAVAVLPVKAEFDDAAAVEQFLARMLPQIGGHAVP